MASAPRWLDSGPSMPSFSVRETVLKTQTGPLALLPSVKTTKKAGFLRSKILLYFLIVDCWIRGQLASAAERLGARSFVL